MSPQVAAALYGGITAGVFAILGVAAGILLERYRHERGRLRCVISNWELAEVESLQQALCSFDLYIFNERLLATGLRDLSVAFNLEGDREAVYPLKHSSLDMSALDLPARSWVHLRPYALFEGRGVHDLPDFRRVDLVGSFPDAREFRSKIVGREDFVASQKRSFDPRRDYTLPWWRRRRRRGKRP
jgi:hypothetical protein